MKNMRSNRAGDTIVEVMIAIIVLGAALGTSIAIATKSQKQTQANHEFYQAQLFANQQAEYILAAYNQALSNGSDRDAFLDSHSSSAPFCYVGPNTTDLVAPAATSCNRTDGAEFRISVQKNLFDTSAPDSVRFVISVQWESLTGSKEDQVELVYAI